MDVSFSVNMHDYEGDVYDECIILHLEGKGALIRLDDLDDLDDFIASIKKCRDEIANAE